jgi:hypothetical protein
MPENNVDELRQKAKQIEAELKEAERQQKAKESDIEGWMEASSQELYEWFHGKREMELGQAFELTKKLYEEFEKKSGERFKKLSEQLIWHFVAAITKPFCAYGIGYLLPKYDSSIAPAGVPIEVSQDDQRFSYLLISLGVHPGSAMHLRIAKYIHTMCHQFGTRTETRLAFHYEPKTFSAYAANVPGKLIKITRYGFDEVPNGTDGQLFVFPETWQPLLSGSLDDLGPEPEFPKSDLCVHTLFADGHLVKHLFKDVHFDVKGLNEKQLRILLMAYLLFLMLPGAVSERVLLECLGPSGSGKTFFAVLMGLVLLGENFKSQPLPSDPKEFENQVINSYYLVYDNVTRVPRDIRDRICQSVTGMDVVRRILYTDRQEMRVPAKATIALSAITPPLPELEHQNRSITINFKERPEGTYVSEIELRKQVIAGRDDIVINLLRRMTLVIGALYAQRDYVPKVNVRLASVATFILRIARHEGWEEEALRLLDAWSGDQLAESLDEDDVSIAIARWMSREAWIPGQWMTATTLNEILTNAMVGNADEDRLLKQMRLKNLSWEASHLILVKKLSANFKVYVARFGLKRGPSKFRNSRGTSVYSFEPTAQQRAEARELAQGFLDEQQSLENLD